MRALRFYMDMGLVREAPRVLWRAASRGQVIVGSVILGLAFFNRPAAQSLSDWEGASPWWGAILLGGLFLVGLLKANHEAFEREERAKAQAIHERDEAQRQLAASVELTEPLADRLDALATEGRKLADRVRNDSTFTRSARDDAITRWTGQAESLLQGEAERYVVIFQMWQEEPMPPIQSAMLPLLGRPQQAWQLDNHAAALRDIALRLRARAGEDIGPQTARRVRLKDILLAAEERLEAIQELLQEEANVSKGDVMAWDEKVCRLVRAALPEECADAVLSEEGFNPWSVSLVSGPPDSHSPAADPQVIMVVVHRGQKVRELQVSLDGMDLRDDFHPQDWERLWD